MRRLAPLAAALATLLVAHGVARAARPVLCAMTGELSSGHCDCETEAPAPAVAPDCCRHPVVDAAPTMVAAGVDLAAPVPSYVAAHAVPVVERAWSAPAPELAATSPPRTLLHRALLI
jgi:hypothetical protein